MGISRRFVLQAGANRSFEEIRFRLALWDAVRHELEAAVRQRRLPAGGEWESPDGIRVRIAVRNVGTEASDGSGRLALSAIAVRDEARREAWAVVARSGTGAMRVTTWVER